MVVTAAWAWYADVFLVAQQQSSGATVISALSHREEGFTSRAYHSERVEQSWDRMNHRDCLVFNQTRRGRRADRLDCNSCNILQNRCVCWGITRCRLCFSQTNVFKWALHPPRDAPLQTGLVSILHAHQTLHCKRLFYGSVHVHSARECP